MISYKSIRTCGLICSLIGGLSSCQMYDDVTNTHPDVPTTYKQINGNEVKGAAPAAKTMTTAKKGSVAKEPVQAATPGPKRTAAPQIPVIQ